LGETCERIGSDLRLRIRLSPGARNESAGGIFRDAQGTAWLRASVRAVPEKGKANEALIELLSRLVAIPRTRFSIAAGGSARCKTIHVSPADEADEAAVVLLERG
jgi:uncharacterized protein YggU (UPF0235/DUF167 family)